MKYLNSLIDRFFSKKANNKNIKELVSTAIKKYGSNADLNHIDVSEVTDFSSLFEETKFKGNIENWDVSNGEIMIRMFHESIFNGDLSSWNVINLKYAINMFSSCEFNGDLSKWKTLSLTSMSCIFCNNRKFNGYLSNWIVDNVVDMSYAFYNTPKFEGSGGLERWDVRNVQTTRSMFNRSSFNGGVSSWKLDSLEDASYMFYDSKFFGDISGWSSENRFEAKNMFSNEARELPEWWWFCYKYKIFENTKMYQDSLEFNWKSGNKINKSRLVKVLDRGYGDSKKIPNEIKGYIFSF